MTSDSIHGSAPDSLDMVEQALAAEEAFRMNDSADDDDTDTDGPAIPVRKGGPKGPRDLAGASNVE